MTLDQLRELCRWVGNIGGLLMWVGVGTTGVCLTILAIRVTIRLLRNKEWPC